MSITLENEGNSEHFILLQGHNYITIVEYSYHMNLRSTNKFILILKL